MRSYSHRDGADRTAEGDSMTWETLSGETRCLTVIAVRELVLPEGKGRIR